MSRLSCFPGLLTAAVSALALGLVVGCSDVENGSVTDPTTTLDEAVFKCNVQPILVRECSYNACHGQAGTALRVYSPGKLRASAPANIDQAIAALTDAEVKANFQSAAAFSWGTAAAEDNWLLRKNIPPSQGGYAHYGGQIFTGTDDVMYTTIRDWLAGKGVCK